MAHKKFKKDDERDSLKEDSESLFPYSKTPYQDEDENLDESEEFYLKSDEELDLGDSEKRNKPRTLDEEKNAGHEP